MGSPITSESFQQFANTADFCEKMTSLLSFSEKMKVFLDFLFTTDGEPTQFLRAVSLPPPGVILPYHTLQTDIDAVKTEIEKLSRTAADIAAEGDPFFRLCDGNHGTPDLRGRFLVGVAKATTIHRLPLGISTKEVNSVGGVETVTLSGKQIPVLEHFHGVGRKVSNNDAANPAMSPWGGANNDYVTIIREWQKAGTYRWHNLWGDKRFTDSGTFESTGNWATSNQVADGSNVAVAEESHDNMPPYRAVYFIRRTARLY
jgi:microcystin-dependent protein